MNDEDVVSTEENNKLSSSSEYFGSLESNNNISSSDNEVFFNEKCLDKNEISLQTDDSLKPDLKEGEDGNSLSQLSKTAFERGRTFVILQVEHDVRDDGQSDREHIHFRLEADLRPQWLLDQEMNKIFEQEPAIHTPRAVKTAPPSRASNRPNQNLRKTRSLSPKLINPILKSKPTKDTSKKQPDKLGSGKKLAESKTVTKKGVITPKSKITPKKGISPSKPGIKTKPGLNAINAKSNVKVTGKKGVGFKTTPRNKMGNSKLVSKTPRSMGKSVKPIGKNIKGKQVPGRSSGLQTKSPRKNLTTNKTPLRGAQVKKTGAINKNLISKTQLKSSRSKSPIGRGRGVKSPINSKTGKPGMGRPGMNKPGLNRPGIGKPGLNRSGINRPGLNRPGLNKSGTNRPGINKPGINRPGLNKPGMIKSGINRPGFNKPGIGKPGSVKSNIRAKTPTKPLSKPALKNAPSKLPAKTHGKLPLNSRGIPAKPTNIKSREPPKSKIAPKQTATTRAPPSRNLASGSSTNKNKPTAPTSKSQPQKSNTNTKQKELVPNKSGSRARENENNTSVEKKNMKPEPAKDKIKTPVKPNLSNPNTNKGPPKTQQKNNTDNVKYEKERVTNKSTPEEKKSDSYVENIESVAKQNAPQEGPDINSTDKQNQEIDANKTLLGDDNDVPLNNLAEEKLESLDLQPPQENLEKELEGHETGENINEPIIVKSEIVEETEVNNSDENIAAIENNLENTEGAVTSDESNKIQENNIKCEKNIEETCNSCDADVVSPAVKTENNLEKIDENLVSEKINENLDNNENKECEEKIESTQINNSFGADMNSSDMTENIEGNVADEQRDEISPVGEKVESSYDSDVTNLVMTENIEEIKSYEQIEEISQDQNKESEKDFDFGETQMDDVSDASMIENNFKNTEESEVDEQYKEISQDDQVIESENNIKKSGETSTINKKPKPSILKETTAKHRKFSKSINKIDKNLKAKKKVTIADKLVSENVPEVQAEEIVSESTENEVKIISEPPKPHVCVKCGYKITEHRENEQKDAEATPAEDEVTEPDPHEKCGACELLVIKENPTPNECVNCMGVLGKDTKFDLKFNAAARKFVVTCKLCKAPLKLAQHERKTPNPVLTPTRGQCSAAFTEMVKRWEPSRLLYPDEAGTPSLMENYISSYSSEFPPPEAEDFPVRPPPPKPLPARPIFKPVSFYNLEFKPHPIKEQQNYHGRRRVSGLGYVKF